MHDHPDPVRFSAGFPQRHLWITALNGCLGMLMGHHFPGNRGALPQAAHCVPRFSIVRVITVPSRHFGA